MKLVAAPQLLLLIVVAARAAPPLITNHARHICTHGATLSHPVEVKHSNLKETQFVLDFDDVEHLNQGEKLGEDDKQGYYYRGRYFSPELHLRDQGQHDPSQYLKSRPNHKPCRMRHTDQSPNSTSDQDPSILDRQALIYNRAVDDSSTTATSHLDVLNPVDKVYDAPVPELKGGVRRRSVEGSSTTPEEVRIKWVPPPAEMPVSEEYEEEPSTPEPVQNDDPKRISSEDAHPQKVDDKGITESATSESKMVRRRRSAGDEESATATPSKATSVEGAPTTSAPKESSAHVKRSAEHDETHKDVKEDTSESSSPSVTESATSEPKKERRRRSLRNEESATATPSKAGSDEGAPATSAPKESSAHVKRSAEHDETHKDVKKDASVSFSPSVTESVTSEPKKERKRRSVENGESETTTPGKASSDDEGAKTTSAPKESSANVKRSAEHDESHEDIKEDASESSSLSVTESATSEPKKERRRRSVEKEESETATPGKASSADEGAPATSAPKESSAHVKRSAEHDETHKDVKEDAPESSSLSVTESATLEPKKERRRRSVEKEESETATPGKASSADGGANATSAPKESSAHVKRSAEHDETHKDVKEDAPESSSPSVTESATSEPKRERKRRSVENGESKPVTLSKATSDDEGANATSSPKESSAHVKRSAEHDETHKDVEEDASESSSPSVTESATSEPKKKRRRRSVEKEESETATPGKASSDDEGANTTSAPKESSVHVKRSAEHNETNKDVKEGASESSSPSVTESATSEPKKARRRRSVGNSDECSHTTSASKENNAHAKRSAEQEGAYQDIKEDTHESSTPVETKSETPEPKKEGSRRRRSAESEKSAEHERPRKAYTTDSPQAIDMFDEKDDFRQIRSAEDEEQFQHDSSEEKVLEKATEEPILKREVSRRRRAANKRQHVNSKEEDAPEEANGSFTTQNPCEKKEKRAAVDDELSTQTQISDAAQLNEQKPDELQEHGPRPTVEALIMGGEENCCKGRHPPGMHDIDDASTQKVLRRRSLDFIKKPIESIGRGIKWIKNKVTPKRKQS